MRDSSSCRSGCRSGCWCGFTSTRNDKLECSPRMWRRSPSPVARPQEPRALAHVALAAADHRGHLGLAMPAPHEHNQHLFLGHSHAPFRSGPPLVPPRRRFARYRSRRIRGTTPIGLAVPSGATTVAILIMRILPLGIFPSRSPK